MPLHIKTIAQYAGHRGSVYSLCVSIDGSHFYTSGDDGIVARWDTFSGANANAVLQTHDAIYALEFMEEENLLLIGTRNGTLHIIDLKTQQPIGIFRKFSHPIYALKYIPAQKTLWILYGEGFLCLYDIEKQKEIEGMRLSEGNLRSIVVENDSVWIGAGDGNIYELELSTAKFVRRWFAHDNTVFSLALVGNVPLLWSGGRDAHLNIWERTNPVTCIEKIPAHNFTINDIVYAPQAQLVATASRDKTIKIWDAHTHTLQKVIDYSRYHTHTHSINRLAFLAEGRQLLSVGDDRKVVRWELSTHS
jgi:WD40 repeat protein